MDSTGNPSISSYHSAMFLCARITEVSMSMGWYLMPLSSSVSSRDPTTYSASCRSVNMRMCMLRKLHSESAYPPGMNPTRDPVPHGGHDTNIPWVLCIKTRGLVEMPTT